MVDVFHYDVASSDSCCQDIWPPSSSNIDPLEMPLDFENFDVQEFSYLQSDITGSEIDVNRLLAKDIDLLTSDPHPVSPNCSVNSEGSSESGYTSQDIPTLQTYNYQKLQAPEFISQLPVDNPANQSCELSKSPIITYAVISENFPQCDLSKTTEHSARIDLAPDGNQSDFDLVGNESDFEDDTDQLQPIGKEINFSGSQDSTLPTVYVLTKKHTSGNSFTDEEKNLLAKEGVSLPENLPLTRMEERVLKKVRRKIRNRQSAQSSRQKRKDYIVNLESRVKKCTDDNSELQRKVSRLEMQNNSLMKQLSHLQAILSNTGRGYAAKSVTTATTGTCLMMVVFSCCFLLIPHSQNTPLNNPPSAATPTPGTPAETVSYNNLASVVSRTLLGAQHLQQDQNDYENSRTGVNKEFPEGSPEAMTNDAEGSRTGESIQHKTDPEVNKKSNFGLHGKPNDDFKGEDILTRVQHHVNNSESSSVKVSHKKSDL